MIPETRTTGICALSEFTRGFRNQVGIEFAKLVRIHGTRHALADFVQPHLGDGVEHAGIDFEAARFDHLRTAGNGNAFPHRGDFAVADDDGRTFDRRPGNWVDLCSGDGVNALRVRRRSGCQRRTQKSAPRS